MRSDFFKHDKRPVVQRKILFFTFSVLVANAKKLLYTVDNLSRGLLNKGKRTKEELRLRFNEKCSVRSVVAGRLLLWLRGGKLADCSL